MNLALVLGQSSENLKSKLISVKDNLRIECFSGLKQFINVSIKRELSYDRIIIISTLVKSDEDIEDLYSFWDNHSRESEIVFLCKKGSDDELARKFLSRFCSTSITSMLVTSTTLNILTEAVVLPVSKITDSYGIPDYLSVEVESDSYFDVEEDTAKEEETTTEEKPTEDTNNKPKEKRSLFGSLFGKKKKKKEQEKVQNSDSNSEVTETDLSTEDSSTNNEPVVNEVPSQSYEEEVTNTDDLGSSFVEDDYSYSPDLDENSQDYNENYEDNTQSVSSINHNNVNDDFYNDKFEESENQDEGYYDYSSAEQDNESYDDYQYEQPSDGYQEEQQVSYVDDYQEDEYNNNYQDNVQDVEDDNYNSYQEEVQDVEDDFGDLTYSDYPQSTQSQGVSEPTAEEVGDVDDLTLGSAEEEYRKKTETPKVIKETVVKEVIKSVKTSSVLENVYKGIAHKLIIVTGDRGAGLTSLAWSLTLHFSKKVPVLYFDCDVVNHGLMNYISYFDFKNYEESHMQGVKLCRSSKAFNSCVCKWDTNIDLLTSDFGVEVSDEELIYSQGIVTENLNKYGVVIVDCPISKLHCVQDLIMSGNVAICVEDNKRGFMNALNALDSSELPLRYKRSIVSKGTIVRTKVNRKNDYKRVLSYINSIVELDECDWLSMAIKEFNGKLTSDLLTQILEG